MPDSHENRQEREVTREKSREGGAFSAAWGDSVQLSWLNSIVLRSGQVRSGQCSFKQ